MLRARSCSSSSRLITAHTASWPGESRGVPAAAAMTRILPPARDVTATAASARRHPQRAVEPDGLAVEHAVLDDLAGQLRVLGGRAEALGERDTRSELR